MVRPCYVNTASTIWENLNCGRQEIFVGGSVGGYNCRDFIGRVQNKDLKMIQFFWKQSEKVI